MNYHEARKHDVSQTCPKYIKANMLKLVCGENMENIQDFNQMDEKKLANHMQIRRSGRHGQFQKIFNIMPSGPKIQQH
jgi:hypothetical protein